MVRLLERLNGEPMSAQEDFIKTQVRIPAELHEQVKVSAENNFRSFNAEILYLLSVGLGNMEAPATPTNVRQVVREELVKTGLVPDAPEHETGFSIPMQRRKA